jgi:hypothetical protein
MVMFGAYTSLKDDLWLITSSECMYILCVHCPEFTLNQYWPGSRAEWPIPSSAPRGGGGDGDPLCVLASRRWGPIYIASYTHTLGSWVDFHEVLLLLMWWRNR